MEKQVFTILLCEDDEMIAPMYEHELIHEGYNVIVVHTGDDVIPTIHEHNPNLVLLDMILPGKMGFEILQELQKDENERFHHIPVIILSNIGQQDAINTAKKLGAVEYLVKSRITPKELGAKIREFLPQDKSVEVRVVRYKNTPMQFQPAMA